jgi:hypothetical protein
MLSNDIIYTAKECNIEVGLGKGRSFVGSRLKAQIRNSHLQHEPRWLRTPTTLR